MREHATRAIMGSAIALVAIATAYDSARCQVAFDEIFEWVAPLVIEDRPDALNAAPILLRDSAGWIVADRMENQIRIYDEAGGLISYFGRQGRGPGEFRHLIGAVRTHEGMIASVDAYGRVGVWTSDGSRMREFSLPMRAVSSVAYVGDNSLILISAPRFAEIDPSHRAREVSAPVVHLVDIGAEQIITSVLAPMISQSAVGAWATISGGAARRFGDRYVVTLPLADTIWEFDTERHIPLSRTAIHHELLDELQEIPDGHADRPAFESWIRRALFVGHAVPAPTGGFFVSLLGWNTEPRLLWVTSDSEEAVEVTSSPSLHGFDPISGLYIFRDPASDEPNRFRLARMR